MFIVFHPGHRFHFYKEILENIKGTQQHQRQKIIEMMPHCITALGFWGQVMACRLLGA